jgi:hypothetical protein
VEPWRADAEPVWHEGGATPARPSRARLWGYTAMVLVGLAISAFTGSIGIEWHGSNSDEAPAVFVPMLFLSVAAFALLVVLPAALLIRSRRRAPWLQRQGTPHRGDPPSR